MFLNLTCIKGWVNSMTWNKSSSLGIAANQDTNIAVVNYKGKKRDLIKYKYSSVTLPIPDEENSFFAIEYEKK